MNDYEKLQQLREKLVDTLILERKKQKLDLSKKLVRAYYNFVNGAVSPSIDTILLLFDEMGYNLVPVKRK